MARAKKLLRLTESPNRHEAARAREEAKRVMGKYGITMEDVEEDVIRVADQERDECRQRLSRAVAQSRRCRAIFNRRGHIAFRGRARNADSAKSLYVSLVKEVTAHCEIGPHDPGRIVWRLCFWTSFVNMVVDRLIDAEVRSWTSTPEENAPTGDAQPVAEAVPSVVGEALAAIQDFAARLDPRDVKTAVEALCRNAHEQGKKLGVVVAIEPFAREPKREVRGELEAS